MKNYVSVMMNLNLAHMGLVPAIHVVGSPILQEIITPRKMAANLSISLDHVDAHDGGDV
jgi:hypothetical protein